MAHDHPELTAVYVRPGSPWRNVVALQSRSGGAGRTLLCKPARRVALIGIVAFTAACQPGSVGPLEPAPGLLRGQPDVYDRPSVLVSANGLAATVSGSWTTRLGANHIDLRVTYCNDGPHAVIMPGAGFAA
ncbi:hypothetical protein [Sphingomonas jatrophae]|uniref:hypothetical protein n=1 Tax=Sphingomonas jatrophae TaxID=1166337 RepID=UPI000B87A8CE|nr:hypothetical protein [Sphingomonas jatrophae]